jgi:hypothetical protein
MFHSSTDCMRVGVRVRWRVRTMMIHVGRERAGGGPVVVLCIHVLEWWNVWKASERYGERDEGKGKERESEGEIEREREREREREKKKKGVRWSEEERKSERKRESRNSVCVLEYKYPTQHTTHNTHWACESREQSHDRCGC